MSETLADAPVLRYAIAPITEVDVRDSSGTFDNTWTMSGYAAVFNTSTTLLDTKFVKLTESVAAGAFDTLLREQKLADPSGVVHFNLNHDMGRAVAATNVEPGRPGSLQLDADQQGLRFLAKVSRDDPDGLAMAVKMRDGVLRQASFAFTIADQVYEESDDGSFEHRTITEVGHLYDVCATPQGAYTTTLSGLRSYAAALGQPAMEAVHVSRTLEGAPGGVRAVSPETGGDPGFSAASLIQANALLERSQRYKRIGKD